jgi:hypothetical protein
MKYELTVTPRKGYLHVRVTGPNGTATIRQYFADTVAACLREGCPNVLIEEYLQGERISIADVFEVVSDNVDLIRSAIRLVAFVDVNPHRSDTNLKFGETVAVNRGLAARVFGDVAEAEGWLTAEILAGPKGPVNPDD